MRFEDFTYSVKNVTFIPDYLLFQVLGESQSTKNIVYRWCKEGKLIRIKRGVYILAPRYKTHPSHLLFQIANNLVSPSYISLDSALSYYGLIPEKIVEITSVCFKRTKKFINDLGNFSYRKLDKNAYPQGIVIDGEGEETFLIANKEKTLLDKIYFSHINRYFNISYLFESLRIGEDDLKNLSFDLITEYAKDYPIKKMQDVAKKLRRHYGF